MRYKLRSSLQGNPNPKEKKKSGEKHLKNKVGNKSNKSKPVCQGRNEYEKERISPNLEAEMEVVNSGTTSGNTALQLKQESTEKLIDVTIEGSDLLQTDPLGLEDEIKIDCVMMDSENLEEEVKGSRRFGNDLTTLTNRKMPVKAKQGCPKAKNSTTSNVQKQKDVQQKPSKSISECLTVEDILKTKSISYLGSVSFSKDANHMDIQDSKNENGHTGAELNDKEQNFAFLFVFTKNEMPCTLNVESSSSSCIVSKKLVDMHDSEAADGDDDVLSVESEVELGKELRTATTKNIRRKHCCVFCGNHSSNLVEHWKTQHESEYLVKRLKELDELNSDDSIKEKKLLLMRLKSEGDYNNNKVILQNFLWSGKVSTKQFYSSQKEPKSYDQIICKICKSVFSRTNLSTHLKTCVVRPTKSKVEKNTAKPFRSPERHQLPQNIEKALPPGVKENINQEAALNSVNVSNPTEDYAISLSSTSEGHISQSIETSKNSDTFPWAKRIRGNHYCVYCKHLVYQFRNHMLKTHKKEGKIQRYNKLLKESRVDTVQERYQIIQDFCDEGDRIYLEIIEKNPSKIKTLSSQLNETLPPHKRKYSDSYEVCRKCRNYYTEEEYRTHGCGEDGYLSEEDEDDPFDWISKLTVSDWDSKVQISENLYLLGGSNQNDIAQDQDVSDHSEKATPNQNDAYVENNMLNKKFNSNQKATVNKEAGLEQNSYSVKEDSSKQQTALNREISSKPETTLKKDFILEHKSTLTKEVSTKEQQTTHNLEDSSKPKTTFHKDGNSDQNTTLNKEPGLMPTYTFNEYLSSFSDDDDYMFRRRQHKAWSKEEKSLVINEFKHFIMSGLNPGTTRCKELIAKHEILSGRNALQVNTMIDNINRGKLKLPPEFQYLQIYNSMY